jgi:hypothetical protein
MTTQLTKLIGAVAGSLILLAQGAAAQNTDPLPSWNDGVNKRAIIEFVDTVTREDGDGFVPAIDRVATFDMDGTILVEKPDAVVMAFTNTYLDEVADANPNLELQPYKAARTNDTAYLTANIFELLTAVGANTDQGDYRTRAQKFAATEKHPKFDRPYDELFFAPMIEVIELLKANDFRVYIVSGSSQGFVRALAPAPTGLPQAHLIGTQTKLSFRNNTFVRMPEFRNLGVVGSGKPLIIQYQIGQKPIFAFGNTNGDQAMLEYALSKTGHPSLALWLDHDDADREYAYDGHVKPVPGLRTVSMKNDFAKLFADE